MVVSGSCGLGSWETLFCFDAVDWSLAVVIEESVVDVVVEVELAVAPVDVVAGLEWGWPLIENGFNEDCLELVDCGCGAGCG